MNCDKIQELLLTDYADNQADPQTHAQVKKHLEACVACRSFEEEVRLATRQPFEGIVHPEVPPGVWAGVREQIIAKKMSSRSFRERLFEALKVFVAPRPAAAFASFAVVVLLVAGILAKQAADKNLVREYFAQQIGFYAALDNGEEGGAQVTF